MENSLIIALHGFLGLPCDWKYWHNQYGKKHKLFAPSLWTHPLLNSSFSFQEWGENFITLVDEYKKQGFNISLWGYSMGGRLALHALTKAPELFTKATIISANPGLDSASEKNLRLQKDLIWSQKFLCMDWKKLMHEWNQQPVFSNTQHLMPWYERNENDFNRTQLSQALNHWSLGRQDSLWQDLSKINTPLEWHVGSFDTAYVSYAQKTLRYNSNIQLTIHEGKGHRLL